jgi:hypothetical protein
VLTEREPKKGKGGPRERWRAMGATLLVEALITHGKTGFTVRAELIDLSSGESKGTADRTYKTPKDAAKAARTVAELLAKLAVPGGGGGVASAGPTAGGEDEPPETPPPADTSTRTVARPAGSGGAVAGGTSEPAPTAVEARLEPKRSKAPLFQLDLAAGSQAYTAYTVVVGSKATALAYKLNPLLLLNAAARLDVPGTGLGIEAEGCFAPAKFALSVMPTVTPASPSARFIEGGGNVLYTIGLGRPTLGARTTFDLEPLLGLRFESFGVDPQAANNVVLSQSSLTPHLGVRARVVAADGLELEAEARGRLVASFSESPTFTGKSGGGFGVTIGAGARYWLAERFGLTLGLAYEYLAVSLSGSGARITFEGDPALQNAKVLTSNFRVHAGGVMAF